MAYSPFDPNNPNNSGSNSGTGGAPVANSGGYTPPTLGGSGVGSPYSWSNAGQAILGAAGGAVGQAVNAGIGAIAGMEQNGQVSGNTAASLSAQNMMNQQNLGQNQAQFNANMATQQAALARRNMMQGVAAPSIANALGYRNPDDIAKIQAQFSQQQQPVAILGTPTVTATSGGGGIGGTSNSANGGGVANQNAYTMSPTASASPVFGKGRTAANSFVQAVQNPFGADLANIVKQKDSGDTAGAASAFTTAYGNYIAAVKQQEAMGGKEALVAQQSLNTPSLQQTIQTLAGQLGVKI